MVTMPYIVGELRPAVTRLWNNPEIYGIMMGVAEYDLPEPTYKT